MRKEQSSCIENKILRKTEIDNYGLKCHLETFFVDLFFKFNL